MFEELPAPSDGRARDGLRVMIRRFLLDPFIILASLLDRRSAERLF